MTDLWARRNDTIFALATPPGKSALAVFRISGPEAGAVLEKLAGSVPEPRRAALRRLRHPASHEVLDEALVLWFPEPNSETGQNLAELQVHGSRAVIAAVTAALKSLPDVRLAAPGEFARRGFYNGKLDLTAIEGLADLIDAETEAQRRQALLQSSGALSKLYNSWRHEIIECMSIMEASIDFSDEGDVQRTSFEGACDRLQSRVLAPLRAHLDDGRKGEILRSGFRVVIAGPPNAGKSSLLNALSRRDVAIVSPEAGTTRDVIEVTLDLAGLPVILSDTAGIRAAPGGVEQEGIRRAIARASEANLVLWLIDAAAPGGVHVPLPPEMQALPILRVLNKADVLDCDPAEAGARFDADIAISVATGAGIEELIEAVAERVLDEAMPPAETPVITQARHREHLQAVLLACEAFLAGDHHHPELRAEELRQAARDIGRITGKVDPEHVLDRIFSRFCIGK